jgi:L-cystine transport system permease protein
MSDAIDALPLLLQGALVTLVLSTTSMISGLALGLCAALLKLSRNPVLNRIGAAYVSAVRGTPLLVQLFLWYYALPQIGVTLGPFSAGILGLSVNVGAYVAESFRAAIQSVDRGQFEASYSLGLTHAATMRRIILPQSIRTALPTIGNTFIGLVKDSSLVSVITVRELLANGQLTIARTFRPVPILLQVAALYWLLCHAFSAAQGWLERRTTRHVRFA